MTTSQWKALLGAAAILLVGATGCTDPTVAPKSSVTDANFFNDPNSYRALLAKIYAGLALTGQQGPAGQPDIQSIDEGFSQYLRLYWQLEELPTDEAVIAWGDLGLRDQHAAVGCRQPVRQGDVLPRVLPGDDGKRVPAPDDGCRAGRAGERQPVAQSSDPAVSRGSPVPPCAFLLARAEFVRQHPARH